MIVCERQNDIVSAQYMVGVVIEVLKVTAICYMYIEVRVELSARLKGGRS